MSRKNRRVNRQNKFENYRPSSSMAGYSHANDQFRRYDYENDFGPIHKRYDEMSDFKELSSGHMGKGPKGYRRSDERVCEDVCEALTQDSGIDASDVEVNVDSGVVMLSGNVNSRRMKRLIEDCAEEISGVQDIRNEIKVQPVLNAGI